MAASSPEAHMLAKIVKFSSVAERQGERELKVVTYKLSNLVDFLQAWVTCLMIVEGRAGVGR